MILLGIKLLIWWACLMIFIVGWFAFSLSDPQQHKKDHL